jgi:hypothetical protein
MATIKTNELSGVALDEAVARCERESGNDWTAHTGRKYSTDWSQAGPIIERERIAILFGPQWTAVHHKRLGMPLYGETLLIAAMRCYVASKLGDTVEIRDCFLIKKG